MTLTGVPDASQAPACGLRSFSQGDVFQAPPTKAPPGSVETLVWLVDAGFDGGSIARGGGGALEVHLEELPAPFRSLSSRNHHAQLINLGVRGLQRHRQVMEAPEGQAGRDFTRYQRGQRGVCAEPEKRSSLGEQEQVRAALALVH